MSLRDFQQGDMKPFVSGFLRGFRMWNYLASSAVGWLQSTGYPEYLWQVGRNNAVCMNKIAIERPLQAGLCSCPECKKPENLRRYEEAAMRKLKALEAHEPPSTDGDICATCGFYGFHKPDMLYANTSYLQLHSNQIGGSIKATGSIVLATLGFRARYAEVEALYGGLNGNGKKVAEHYGVPWFKTQAELVEQFPFVPLEGHEYEDPTPPKPAADIWTGLLLTKAVQWVPMAP